MDINKLPPGRNPPHEINVLIEVPLRSDPIKYEYDKENGFIFVDRYLYTTMFYPCNYGFIPNTLSCDGDPVDVMVVGRMPVVPGAILRARPIGVLMMEDEAGQDEKILAVPIDKITQIHRNVQTYKDIPRDRPRPDHPLLRALQGPGAQQVGEGAGLGGRRRGASADPRRHRPRQRPIGLRPRFRTRPRARPGPVP